MQYERSKQTTLSTATCQITHCRNYTHFTPDIRKIQITNKQFTETAAHTLPNTTTVCGTD